MAEKSQNKICFKQTGCKNPNPQPLSNFYKHPQMADGHLNKCILCTRSDINIRRLRLEATDPEWKEKERVRHIEKAYRQRNRLSATKKGKALLKQWHDKANSGWRKNNPMARKAHAAVQKAVSSGRLIRPQICDECKNAARIVEAHHDDYSKPLEVKWLCKKCHIDKTFYEKKRSD